MSHVKKERKSSNDKKYNRKKNLHNKEVSLSEGLDVLPTVFLGAIDNLEENNGVPIPHIGEDIIQENTNLNIDNSELKKEETVPLEEEINKIDNVVEDTIKPSKEVSKEDNEKEPIIDNVEKDSVPKVSPKEDNEVVKKTEVEKELEDIPTINKEKEVLKEDLILKESPKVQEDIIEDNVPKGIDKNKRLSYKESQHKELLTYIGVEDKNFMFAVAVVVGLGGMFFWQITQLFNLIKVSQDVTKLEEPITWGLMVTLVLFYFYQKKMQSTSVFAPILEKDYYIHQVKVLKKELINNNNSTYLSQIQLEEYDEKIEVIKNIYDKVKVGETVDVVYCNTTHKAIYIVPTITVSVAKTTNEPTAIVSN